jgi:hypothetical protein
MAADATVFEVRGWMLVTKPLSLVKNLERERKRKALGLGFGLKINFKLKFGSFLEGCRWCWQASMVEGKV